MIGYLTAMKKKRWAMHGKEAKLRAVSVAQLPRAGKGSRRLFQMWYCSLSLPK